MTGQDGKFRLDVYRPTYPTSDAISLHECMS